jgi:hypothetical protein
MEPWLPFVMLNEVKHLVRALSSAFVPFAGQILRYRS